jgi:hypothetical protein
MTTEIEKVTAFVTRTVNGRRELLLFEHPYAATSSPPERLSLEKRRRQPPSAKRPRRPACATL